MPHHIRRLSHDEGIRAAAICESAGAIPSEYNFSADVEWFGILHLGNLLGVIARCHDLEKNELVIAALAVEEVVRGSGIGRELVEFALSPFMNQAIDVVGSVKRTSTGAQTFYEKLGFTITECDLLGRNDHESPYLCFSLRI
jgi:ribosomal protein S18 acetylase RimI-like enzyme